jgi:hypothetical protein
MARSRRTSAILETSRQRLAGLKAIAPAPDLGPTITVPAYQALIDAFISRLGGYNQKVAELDDEQNGIDADELVIRDWNKRVLSAVEAQFGPDSSEYEQVGGTRQSERKRPTRKAKGSAAPPNP